MNDEKSLTAKEISSIIRACKSSGVKELQFMGLSIKFDESEKATSQWTHYPAPKMNHWADDPHQFEKENPEDFPASEVDLEDLQITDPVQWENLRTQG